MIAINGNGVVSPAGAGATATVTITSAVGKLWTIKVYLGIQGQIGTLVRVGSCIIYKVGVITQKNVFSNDEVDSAGSAWQSFSIHNGASLTFTYSGAGTQAADVFSYAYTGIETDAV